MDPPDELLPRRPTHAHTHSTGSMPHGRKRVGFTSETISPDESHPTSPVSEDRDDTGLAQEPSHEMLSEELHRAFGQPYVPKPRPAIRRTGIGQGSHDLITDENDVNKQRSGRAAQKRAAILSKSVGTYSASAPGSRRNSDDRSLDATLTQENSRMPNVDREDLEGESTDDDEEVEGSAKKEFMKEAAQLLREHTRHGPIIREADLYHPDADSTPLPSGQVTPINDMEIEDEHIPKPPKFRMGVLGTLLKASSSVPMPGMPGPPQQKPSRKATGHGRNPSSGSLAYSDASTLHSPMQSPGLPPDVASPSRRPRAWYSRSANSSMTSLPHLVESSSMLAVPGQKDTGHEMKEQSKKQRPQRPGLGKRNISSTSLSSLTSAFKLPKVKDESYKIKIHLAGTLARQNYLRKLCKALMMYGAPTHRLEEYMNMSARVLEIEAQFLYMPGCMIIAFDDSSVHTSEVKLVRTSQGVDLGKLQDVHEIYKDVVHDRIGVDEATPRLEAIIARKTKYNSWGRVPIYGLASAMVGPFAFEARPIDLPFCFVLGCILGWLQLIVAPQHELIGNVFEITAAIVTSFMARGLGSIRHNGKEIFCFSAMAQSSIALILPGFTVLCASLELQSRHIVAGSVRMVYAIIYSLFLGFGITIGTVIYGMMDKNATSATHCKDPLNSRWYYFFVLAFATCLIIINQGKWKQMPIMILIALIGYAVSFNSSRYFKGNSQVSSTLGALAIGISANLHARFGRHIENMSLDKYENSIRPRWVRFRKRWLRRSYGDRRSQAWANLRHKEEGHDDETHLSHSPSSSLKSEPYTPRTRQIGFGLAAAAMLPAIFVQVPSGLSVSGSLVSGITSADQITRNGTGVTTASGSDVSHSAVNSVALQVGFSVIQVAIGITVGLFLAALLVYPLGKRRSGLFSF